MLLIGEHGRYPTNAIGQKQYPRYELFSQIAKVFKEDGRTTPVFNDKHLSWKFEWAKEMVETARAMNFPLLAGSSLPVTWRMPAIDLPYGAEVEEIVGVAFGAIDIYDFHALEMMQSHGRAAKRRRNGRRRAFTPCAATPSGMPSPPARWPPAAGRRACSKPASRAARRWPKTNSPAIAIRRSTR